MRRELTSHKANGLNECIKIEVLDEPGSGNLRDTIANARALAKFAVHIKGCPARKWNSLDRTYGMCTCGLKKLLQQVE